MDLQYSAIPFNSIAGDKCLLICRVILGHIFLSKDPVTFDKPPCRTSGCYSTGCEHSDRFDSIMVSPNNPGPVSATAMDKDFNAYMEYDQKLDPELVPFDAETSECYSTSCEYSGPVDSVMISPNNPEPVSMTAMDRNFTTYEGKDSRELPTNARPLSMPREFVVFDSHSIYPEYLVSYRG